MAAEDGGAFVRRESARAVAALSLGARRARAPTSARCHGLPAAGCGGCSQQLARMWTRARFLQNVHVRRACFALSKV